MPNDENNNLEPNENLPDSSSNIDDHSSAGETAKSSQPNEAINQVNTPGVLILQWLTYAFWGWTLIALYWLTSFSIGYFVNQSDNDSGNLMHDSNDLLAYSLAAVIVLFLIAIICDYFYSKREPINKTGPATIIMVIHSVIFALFGIGSLIVGVFAFVNMLISGDNNQSALTVMATAAIMTSLYALTLLRSLRPKNIKRIVPIYWLVMTISTLIIMCLGVFGPIAYTQLTKNDRAIETGLPSVARAINDYASENGKLPTSLNDQGLELLNDYNSADIEQIIDDELITYLPKEKLSPKNSTMPGSGGISLKDMDADRFSAMQQEDPVFHYQLCATYEKEKTGRYSRSSRYYRDQKYDVNPNTSSHKKGNVCYDLQTGYLRDY